MTSKEIEDAIKAAYDTGTGFPLRGLLPVLEELLHRQDTLLLAQHRLESRLNTTQDEITAMQNGGFSQPPPNIKGTP